MKVKISTEITFKTKDEIKFLRVLLRLSANNLEKGGFSTPDINLGHNLVINVRDIRSQIEEAMAFLNKIDVGLFEVGAEREII